MLIVLGHRMVGLKIFTPKLIDLKSAFVHVKMNVTFFKIRRTGLPNLGFGVQSLHRKPSAVTDSFRVLLGRNEQNLKLVVVGLLVDFQNDTTNALAVNNDAIGFAVGRVDTALNGFARDDLTVKIHVVVTLTELHHRPVLEGPLIFKNELLAVV